MKKSRLLIIATLLITPLVIGGSAYVEQAKAPTPPDSHWLELDKEVRSKIRRFPGVSAIYIRDLKTGWTITHNEDLLFPSASLVKLPMMATIYQAQHSGKLSLEESLPLLKKFKVRGSGKLRRQKNGSRYRIRELVYRMITESDNTATNILADRLDLDYFNRKFLDMGLSHTNLARNVMDLRSRDEGIENYTTARDMGSLLEMLYFKDITGSNEMIEILKGQKIDDRLAMGIPSSWQIGNKTGLMNNACHDVGIVYSPSNDYVICVLTTKMRIRSSKRYISSISKLAASYYGDPSVHRAPEEKSFWTQVFGHPVKVEGRAQGRGPPPQEPNPPQIFNFLVGAGPRAYPWQPDWQSNRKPDRQPNWTPQLRLFFLPKFCMIWGL